MKGAIIINGFYESKAYSHQISRIVEEFGKRNEHLQIIKNDMPYATYSKLDIDYAIFLDKDTNLARLLENAGVVLFNNSFAIENCDDKIKTSLLLERHSDIFLPKTLIAPLKYKTQQTTEEFYQILETELGYPMVAKKAIGSLGKSIYLINDREELEQKEAELSVTPHLYQVYVEESKGQSVRAFVIGNKVVACMLLTNDCDFRSNIEPSRAEKVELDTSYIESAERISKYLDLDYCAVDFFVGAAMVIEVNSNAYFQKIEDITGANIAGIYADFVLEFIKELKG